MNTNRCATCNKHIDVCPNGGDCGEVRAIYREQQREKLRDIDPDEILCDVCGYSYAERSHDDCHWGESL